MPVTVKRKIATKSGPSVLSLKPFAANDGLAHFVLRAAPLLKPCLCVGV